MMKIIRLKPESSFIYSIVHILLSAGGNVIAIPYNKGIGTERRIKEERSF
jgi:hypothetical protein